MSATQRPAPARTLYGFWMSPFFAMVVQVLKESGLDFAYERVSPFSGAILDADYLARNPLAKVPTLEEGGRLVSESQAICRYLARTHAGPHSFYPCDDAVRCAEVDALNDFLTFSISGPFFNWFVAGAYYPQAFKADTEQESRIFSAWSVTLIKGNLGRLAARAPFEPFLLGSDPLLPDFHLFHVLELGRTLSRAFDMPMLDLTRDDPALTGFHETMAARAVTREILAAQADEYPQTERELFGEFGKAYAELLKPGNALLGKLFGHEI